MDDLECQFRRKANEFLEMKSQELQAKIDSFGNGDEYDERMFLWELMPQEVLMFGMIGEPVAAEEMDALCSRRGFSPDHRAFLEAAVDHMGLKGW